jgi:ABC-type long-subunit fatty acid transport system fused permease/ATPase subunit
LDHFLLIYFSLNICAHFELSENSIGWVVFKIRIKLICLLKKLHKSPRKFSNRYGMPWQGFYIYFLQNICTQKNFWQTKFWTKFFSKNSSYKKIAKKKFYKKTAFFISIIFNVLITIYALALYTCRWSLIVEKNLDNFFRPDLFFCSLSLPEDEYKFETCCKILFLIANK